MGDGCVYSQPKWILQRFCTQNTFYFPFQDSIDKKQIKLKLYKYELTHKANKFEHFHLWLSHYSNTPFDCTSSSGYPRGFLPQYNKIQRPLSVAKNLQEIKPKITEIFKGCMDVSYSPHQHCPWQPKITPLNAWHKYYWQTPYVLNKCRHTATYMLNTNIVIIGCSYYYISLLLSLPASDSIL